MNKLTVIEGDGIGPEVMNSVIKILKAMNAPLDYDFQPAGLEHFERTGETLPQSTINSIRKK